MPHRLNNVPSFAEIYPLRTVIDRATREYASREIGVNGRTTVWQKTRKHDASRCLLLCGAGMKNVETGCLSATNMRFTQQRRI